MTNDESLVPPQPEGRDHAIAGVVGLAKGALGAVPFAGTFLAEMVDLLYRQPIDRRRDEWMRDVADALEEVRRRRPDLIAGVVAENEEFVTIVHRATEVALRTHEKQKRRMLRNALWHSALPSAASHDLQLYFLRLIEELTVTQVLILNLYNDPAAWFRKTGHNLPEFGAASRFEVLRAAYPQLASSPNIRELTISDLERRGLLGGLNGIVSGHSLLDRVTSTLAQQFLEYVSEDQQ
jgi:hypothetical protein